MPNRQERRRQERLSKKQKKDILKKYEGGALPGPYDHLKEGVEYLDDIQKKKKEQTKPQGWGWDVEQTKSSGDASTRLDELQGQNEAIVFPKIIPQETCQKIIKLGEGRWSQAQTFGSRDEGKDKLNNVRRSDVFWITDEQWAYELIWAFMMSANEQAEWNYNITAAENCQVTRYTKDGYYTWHKDGMGSHKEVHNNPASKPLHGMTRKLSMTIVLNDDYEGGDFEISGLYRAGIQQEPDLGRLEEGSVIVFPSFIEHRVAPVTKGTRYSLVAWFVGPPFV
jgi:PKHD-type hydroxylase